MRTICTLLIIALLLLAALFALRDPVRYGTYGDNFTASNCPIRDATFDEAPSERTLTLTGYYLISNSIENDRNQWGKCPYQHYKAKTAAIELWLLPLALTAFMYGKKLRKN